MGLGGANLAGSTTANPRVICPWMFPYILIVVSLSEIDAAQQIASPRTEQLVG